MVIIFKDGWPHVVINGEPVDVKAIDTKYFASLQPQEALHLGFVWGQASALAMCGEACDLDSKTA